MRENSQVSAAGTSPVVAIASARASGSHVAYAWGASLCCTACAATVTVLVCQLGTRASALKKAVAAKRGFMISAGVPQPCEGRCWNKPSESRSPYRRLCSSDSWSAVASAIVTAWSGMPSCLPTAVIVVAFAACCGSITYVEEPTATRQTDGREGLPRKAPVITSGTTTIATTVPSTVATVAAR